MQFCVTAIKAKTIHLEIVWCHITKIRDRIRDGTKKSTENEAICDDNNKLCPVKSFRLKQSDRGDCVYYTKLVCCSCFLSSVESSGTQLMYISSKCPKCTKLLSCPSLVTRKDGEEKICVQTDRNGEWSDCRMSCMYTTRWTVPGTNLSYAWSSITSSQKWLNVNLSSGLEFVSNRWGMVMWRFGMCAGKLRGYLLFVRFLINWKRLDTSHTNAIIIINKVHAIKILIYRRTRSSH